jgi:cytochrome c peroxidase
MQDRARRTSLRPLLGPLLAVGGLALLGGCRNSGGPFEGISDRALRAQIAAHGLTGDPMAGRTAPDPASPLAKLGARLFFSKVLGADRDSACVSCHHPLLGGGDGLPLPIGVDAVEPDRLGRGRLHASGAPGHDGGPTVPRNAPSTFNLLAWDSVLFHDGRVESLVKTKGAHGSGGGIRTPDVPHGSPDPLAGSNLSMAQARFPVTSPEEMKGFDHDFFDNQEIRDFVAGRMGNHGFGVGELAFPAYWLERFREGFQSPTGAATTLITEQNVARAIAEYELSQVLVDTPWKRYVEGDDAAIPELAKQGGIVFFTPVAQGGAGCASCHAGDFFTDELFHNIGMPQIGRGKGDGVDGREDFGRFRETGNPVDRYAFRTPTLLNVAVTGPWGHAGAYTSLAAAVRHHFDPIEAVGAYNTTQVTQPGVAGLDMSYTQGALYQLTLDRLHGRPAIPELEMGDLQVAQLVAFLEALTDPCTRDPSCMAQWIPDPTVNVDPNGDHLNATLPSP